MYKVNKLGFLKENSYWGRGIIIGKNSHSAVVAYFIMGRSENSRNRYFYEKDDNIAIAPFELKKEFDPSLVVYYPVKTFNNSLIVTNGDQTDTIHEFLSNNRSFEDALRTRKFEPDAPNFTPRISGILNFTASDLEYKMSILKSSNSEGEACNRQFFEYCAKEGEGHFIHTYMKNDNPLPSFEGEPKTVEILDDFNEFGNTIWKNLDEDNKISLMVRFINLNTGDTKTRIYNKRKGD
ncbi:MAG: IMP cyclohydrolase [Peptostreptococcaceae bacterium]|nr:IMP cyclohydrolase [Peptostreptococcaceae bacterium]